MSEGGTIERIQQLRELVARVDVLTKQARAINETLRALLADAETNGGTMRRDVVVRDAMVLDAVGDEYETARQIAGRLGMGVTQAQQALYRARARGAPIEAKEGYGWRRVRDRSLWHDWRTAS